MQRQLDRRKFIRTSVGTFSLLALRDLAFVPEPVEAAPLPRGFRGVLSIAGAPERELGLALQGTTIRGTAFVPGAAGQIGSDFLNIRGSVAGKNVSFELFSAADTSFANPLATGNGKIKGSKLSGTTSNGGTFSCTLFKSSKKRMKKMAGRYLVKTLNLDPFGDVGKSVLTLRADGTFSATEVSLNGLASRDLGDQVEGVYGINASGSDSFVAALDTAGIVSQLNVDPLNKGIIAVVVFLQFLGGEFDDPEGGSCECGINRRRIESLIIEDAA